MSICVSIGGATPVGGQGVLGAVRGVAKSEDGSVPIPFALVRLLPADSPSAAGRRPVLSPAIDVRAGGTIEHELRGSMIAIPLPTVVVYGDGACLGRERAASDPYLSSLWDEVREGIEIRRAFVDRPPRFGGAASAFVERSGWTARPASCDGWNSST